MGSEWILGRSSWLRIETGGGLLWIRLWTFGFWCHVVSYVHEHLMCQYLSLSVIHEMWQQNINFEVRACYSLFGGVQKTVLLWVAYIWRSSAKKSFTVSRWLVQTSHPPQKFNHPPFCNDWSCSVKVTFNGMAVWLNFIKICKLVQNLLGGTERYVVSLGVPSKEGRLRASSALVFLAVTLCGSEDRCLRTGSTCLTLNPTSAFTLWGSLSFNMCLVSLAASIQIL
jgi:hypothetical protein